MSIYDLSLDETLKRIRGSARKINGHRGQIKKAKEDRDKLIMRALDLGASEREVATVAKMSAARVHQIRDEQKGSDL